MKKVFGKTLSPKKILKKIVKKVLKKALPKFMAKAAAKKVPVVGAVVGGIFAIGKLFTGDFAGAGLELSSGVASCVPGVGTAASIGLDVIQIVREI